MGQGASVRLPTGEELAAVSLAQDALKASFDPHTDTEDKGDVFFGMLCIVMFNSVSF